MSLRTTALLLWSLCMAFSSMQGSNQNALTVHSVIEPCPRDPSAFEHTRALADQNQAEAQATMFDCYEQGRNVNPDGKEAIRWLTLSAQNGFVPAEYELGRTYLYGRGIPADYTQAIVWEGKAAKAGHLSAQNDMALIYERGFGVAADPEQAVFWSRKAAEQGDASAQLRLADALDRGYGVKRDSHQALNWYRKAAQQRMAEANLRIAEIYARDPHRGCDKAVTWYQKAARGGLSEAMYQLGKIYEHGTCGHANAESALAWFEVGALHGSRDCRIAASALEPKLTPAQRMRAMQTADLWIQQNQPSTRDEDEESDKH